MAVAFAAKLQMAAIALGCSSRKEFCNRFRSVNAATHCDLDRLNKWMQGRSLPRASSVYADLAAVIGTAQPGRWIAECSLDAFAAELVARTGVDSQSLTLPGDVSRHGHSPGTGLFGGVATLAGAFAAYSPAWSPHLRGRLVRGALRLAVGRSGSLAASYCETLVGRDVVLTGEAWISSRTMHFMLREPDGKIPVFFSLHIPGPPASVICGVMSGVAFIAHEPLPSASRIVFIRVPDTAALNASNRYFDPEPGAIQADLSALGVDGPDAAELDALTREFVASPSQATSQDQATFAALLDRRHVESAGAA